MLISAVTGLSQSQSASIEPSDTTQSDTLVTKSVIINKVFVLGNKKTKANIILRELSVKPGRQLDILELEKIIEEDRNKIYNTNLFNDVTIQILQLEDGRVDLLITVDERWYFYPSPMVRIADRNFMDWLINRDGELNRFIYGLRLDQFNFRGRNEQLRFLGQLGFRRRFLLKYIMPYIEPSQRHGLIFDFIYNEEENVAYITEDHLPTFLDQQKINRDEIFGSITHSFRPSFYTFHYTSIGLKSGTISDSIATLNPNYFGNGKTRQKSINLSYSFIKDQRNIRAYPTEGSYLNVRLEKVGIGVFGDVDITRLWAKYAKYSDLGNGFYAANGIWAVMSGPKEQPYSNYIGLGYDDIFARGYELEVVEGYQFLLSQNSFRKKLFSTKKNISKIMPIRQFQTFPLSMYAKIFSDIGWVNNYPEFEISSRLSNSLLYSVGVGLDVQMIYDLVLRFEYSYNAERDLNFALNIKADI
ncbi:MAG: BamA/TamA family outer membrane protein [Cyclobacteriaceae bacterium]|nr:BamA/TamA family outer membrane protein [Cyclobacteriaceae bacterium HetDA_MAG_MS6]